MGKLGGYRRTLPMPARERLRKAFLDLGTQTAVADFFNVTRPTILKWATRYSISVESRPEILRAKRLTSLLSDPRDRVRVAQWLVDEGSISTSYDAKNDNTFLTVSGAMVDIDTLNVVGRILGSNVNCERYPSHLGWLPMSCTKLRSAEAYALLKSLRGELLGLKAMEAVAALAYFPASGYLPGRHTTDEFLLPVWKLYSSRVVTEWNKKRRLQLTEDQLERMAKAWVSSRVKRARTFLDVVASLNSSKHSGRSRIA
jgi:hypothetical protein